MYERLLVEREASIRQTREEADKRAREVSEAWDRASERAKETAERAMDRMADTAQEFARSRDQGSSPVIITGTSSGESRVIRTGGEGDQPQSSKEERTKNCPQCSKPVAMDAHFCQHCQYEFPG
jgi:hypothetical protein